MRSLRGRLSAWLLAGIGLLVTVAAVFLDRTIVSRIQQDFDAGLLAKARSVMAAVEVTDGRTVLELSPRLIPNFEVARSPDYFQIWRADGHVLARSRSLGGESLGRLPAPARAFRFAWTRLPGGRRGRRAEVTFLPQTEEDGELSRQEAPPGPQDVLTLVVASGSESLDAFHASLHRRLALFTLILLLGSAALVRAATAYALRPLTELNRRLMALDAGSLGETVVIAGAPAELAPTIGHLNGLLARLAASFRRERTFSANVAHELRTPLAEMRTVTDVAIEWPDDPASLLGALLEVREAGWQMERIVVSLLALARYDGGQRSLQRTRVPLRPLAESCWRVSAAEAQARGMTICLEIPEDLALITDREKLEIILCNLLANAGAYGSPGGRILCSATAAEGRFRLRVTNPTTELSGEELASVFDRFWRRDAARSDGRHLGLGLSLVAALCEVLGFEKEASVTDGIFEISFSGPVGTPEAAAMPKGAAFLPVSS